MDDNVVTVNYSATGDSTVVDSLGMREMQARAYKVRSSQYILLKAPPASGKSRALMYIALDKLKTNAIKKVIVSVPERSIGKSFMPTDLVSGGFHSDWKIDDYYNLCSPGGDDGKVNRFKQFIESDSEILLCTHSTLRFANSQIGYESFNNCLIAIDEFHHVSSDYENKLGELLRGLIDHTDAHILAMTGSYFRGDCVPVLDPFYEMKFTKVTYNYYEQLNGYKYLKSLGINFHFYVGKYTKSVVGVLDTKKKTILHIPNVNSGESTKDKYNEVNEIIDSIGEVIRVDDENQILVVKLNDGRIIRVADLVDDNEESRQKTITYLRNIKDRDDVDLIIALGMAKEGFDWPYCEHALTVGYRGSLTEIVQIIGRCTRDCPDKTHAQFTNLIAEPDAEDSEIVRSVNNILKAITASLLMEQVLAPKITFHSKDESDDDDNSIVINGIRPRNSKKVDEIIESDLPDLKAAILQDQNIIESFSSNLPPEIVNKVLIPKIIETRYPGLSEDEIEQVREHLVTDFVLKKTEINTIGNTKFIKMCDKFINVDDLDMDLIDSINPLQQSFEVLSKSVTPRLLKAIQDCISTFKVNMTLDEAYYWWPKINNFVKIMGRKPSLDSSDSQEKRMAEALLYLKQIKREHDNEKTTG